MHANADLPFCHVSVELWQTHIVVYCNSISEHVEKQLRGGQSPLASRGNDRDFT